MLPLPIEGRVYRDQRRVRLGDASPRRRLRLDAVARYLQDVAEDDAAEAGLPASIGWVLRSTRVSVRRFPALGEQVELATFCSGTAARWAERTTTVAGDAGGLLQATSVWVAIDVTTGAPARLGDRFGEVYGPAAGGRRASARLVLEGPPDDARRDARPWPLRAVDLDVWGHANNAVAWAALEDAVDPGRYAPAFAEVEHHRAIEPGCRPVLAARHAGTSAAAWLLDADSGAVLASARVQPLGDQPSESGPTVDAAGEPAGEDREERPPGGGARPTRGRRTSG